MSNETPPRAKRLIRKAGKDACHPLWISAADDGLVWEYWESECSLFDRRTGETHLIGVLPAELLRLMSDTPRSAADLSRTLAELCEQEDSTEWKARIDNMLSSLKALELARPCA